MSKVGYKSYIDHNPLPPSLPPSHPTWYSLIVTPSIFAPEKMAIFLIGPPTPHPTSNTRMPGLRPKREHK